MKRTIGVVILFLALAGTWACEEQREFEGTPIFAVTVNGKGRAELKVPLNLAGLEKKLLALTSDGFQEAGGGGSPVYTSSDDLGFVFYTSSDVVGSPYGSTDTAGSGYFPGDVAPGYFGGGGVCDFASEACMFAQAVCQYIGPIAASFGTDPDEVAEGMAECSSMNCSLVVGEIEGLIDAQLPGNVKCALATILSCVTPQVPALAAALQSMGPGGLENEQAMETALTPIAAQVGACLGPHMSAIEQVFSGLADDSGAGNTSSTFGD